MFILFVEGEHFLILLFLCSETMSLGVQMSWTEMDELRWAAFDAIYDVISHHLNFFL
jgi:hypothetical protein